MKPQPGVDTQDLEQQIAQLQKNLAFVGQTTNSDASELYKIIHRPGWTTVVDVAMATQIVQNMNQQAAALRGLRDTLDAHVKAAAKA